MSPAPVALSSSPLPSSSPPKHDDSEDNEEEIQDQLETENLTINQSHPQKRQGILTERATPSQFRTPRVLADIANLRTPRVNPRPLLPAMTPKDQYIDTFMKSLAQSGRPRFAAPTPHPRQRGGIRGPRLSHPLAQVVSRDLDSDTGPGGAGTGDASFISTTSSHDLAVAERANASFDPTTDTNAPFNQVKLNTYLRGLNKQLMKENEVLTLRLAEYMEGTGGEGSEVNSAIGGTPRSVISARSEDASVAHAGSTSAVVASHNVLDELVTTLQDELAVVKADRDDLEAQVELIPQLSSQLADLRQRHEERAGDIQRLQQELEHAHDEARERSQAHSTRMKEVQEGTDAIMAEMQANLNDARSQISTLKARLAAQEEAEAGQEKEIERVRIKMAEERADAMSDAKLEAEQARLRIESELRTTEMERDSFRDLAEEFEQKVQTLEEERERVRAELSQAMAARTSASAELNSQHDQERRRFQNQIAELQSELESQTDRAASLEEELGTLEDRLVETRAQAAQFELALQESEKKMTHDAEDIRVMRSKIDVLIRERDAAESRATQAKILSQSQSRKVSRAFSVSSDHSSATAASGGPAVESLPLEEHNRIVAELEEELEDVQREIARLEYIAKDSNSAQAIANARNISIEMLEKENLDLNDKITILKEALQPLASASASASATPARAHQSSLKVGTPQTIKKLQLLDKVLRTPAGPNAADVSATIPS